MSGTNSGNGAAGAGHAALLIKYNKEWRYYSWESEGYKSSTAQLKVVQKGIKGTKLINAINDAKNVRRPKKKPYDQYIYISASKVKTIK